MIETLVLVARQPQSVSYSIWNAVAFRPLHWKRKCLIACHRRRL